MQIKTSRDLQNFAKEKFKKYFNEETITERRSIFKIDEKIYSPEPDVAVGPLATKHGEKHINKYNEMLEKSKDFLQECINLHKENLNKQNAESLNNALDSYKDLKSKNKNARCFMAVEIENETTLKHLLGSTINAIALGKIGLLVGFKEERVEKFIRCLRYLRFLENVNKSSINFGNSIILSKEQFTNILENIC